MDMEHTEVEAAEPLGFFSSAREQKTGRIRPQRARIRAVHGRLGGNDSLGESPGQDTPERKNIPKYD